MGNSLIIDPSCVITNNKCQNVFYFSSLENAIKKRLVDDNDINKAQSDKSGNNLNRFTPALDGSILLFGMTETPS